MNSLNSCILKLTAVCNLDCSYCYMFRSADRTFERVPAQMPIEVAISALSKIGRHIDSNLRGSDFTIVLHGGEPTLWPIRNFARLLERIEELRRRGAAINVGLQSNGFRPLHDDMLTLFQSHKVSLGISADGPAVFNDTFRLTHDGKGSYDRIMSNISSLFDRGFGNVLSGFLTVANPSIPPEAFLDWLAILPLSRVDVLWPIQFSLDSPPWATYAFGDPIAYAAQPVYGVWFADLFSAWLRRDDPRLYIRSFFNLVELSLGGRNHIDSLVNDHLGMFVVNTDGRIEFPDYFRAVVDEGANSGLNVLTDELAELARDPVFSRLLQLKNHLPTECSDCRHREVCGGGFLPGRTSRSAVLSARRSVLCPDQKYFFERVARLLPSTRNNLKESPWRALAGTKDAAKP